MSPIRVLVGLGAVAVLTLVGFLVFCLATLPHDGGLRGQSAGSAVFVADDGRAFAMRGQIRGGVASLADLGPHLPRAIVAIEDRRFYEHPGFDIRGMARALWRNLSSGGTVEGASTLTQQLARLLYLSPDRTLRRKVQEVMLAVWLEHQLGKDEILVRYLNTAYFGAGTYGVDAAARRYFEKAPKDLSLGEAAMLAGLVRAPTQLAPHRNLDSARARARTVLAAMRDADMITAADVEAAGLDRVAIRSLHFPASDGAGYFVDMAAAELRALFGEMPADFMVRTTLDPALQALAEEVIEARLSAEGGAKRIGQAALVAIGPDGAVKAAVGGRDYAASQFNRVTQARRQPGSLFKLFVYLAALEHGADPDTRVVDRPVRIGDWEPQNYGGGHAGTMDLRQAFAKSINTVAVQLSEEVGRDRVIATARRLGIRSEIPSVPSIALGTAEVSLMEITGAYGSIATGREPFEPFLVQTVEGPDRRLYDRARAAPAAAPPSNPDRAGAREAMRDLLASVVRSGTGHGAAVAGTAVAGKTGTTQDNRDAWFVGYTDALIVGVWVGNDDNTPMQGVTGGDVPAAIWHDFVAKAVATRPSPPPAIRRPADGVAAMTGDPDARAAPGPTGSAPADAEVSADQDREAVSGRAKVIDTATLEIDGTVVRLKGIEPSRGRPARSLARFIRRKPLDCQRIADGWHRCEVGGRDLAWIILSAGGSSASPDADDAQREAEAIARERRLGIWRRR
ncbi:PBP1A family penicillin-binding protein [Prosthecomicrobium sp. N25]|uniref:PBP1A family penicillin-binding protein n=1 Tax=Prosthecomicrobium sp. N25 TaxID=3129254 RepID=UPI003077C164